MNECPMCNTHNPPQAVTCRTCKLSLPRSNAPSIFHTSDRPKMAVFDLDRTLFDLSRRERAAKRQGLKPSSKKWFEVINQNKYILMDTPIKGTVKFVNQLSENGFTIAYLSGRPRASLAATKQSLQESGFPIDADEQDLVFLHSGKGSIPNITNHKKSVLTHLKNKFDVDFFFDDTPEFREAAKSLFIPGVYPSIAAYTEKEERPKKRARKNPEARKNHDHSTWGLPEGDDLCNKYGYFGENGDIDEQSGHYYVCGLPRGHEGPCSFDHEMWADYEEHPDGSKVFIRPPYGDGDKDEEELAKLLKEEEELYSNPHTSAPNCGCGKTPCVTYGGGVTTNPAPKPRKKRDKAGRMRKETLKKYIDRFMGDKKMNEEFPDRSQRFAVGLSYARKFYGDAKVDKAYPRPPRSNPGNVSEAKKMYQQFHKKQPKSVKKKKIDFGDTWVGLGKAWSIGYRSGKETGNETQKYIHNFGVDEESGKKFAEPELYYVKNKDGSQMMVVMGGDWYIDVDEAGEVSWIYI